MDPKPLLKDLDGVVEKTYQIQANLKLFGAQELDVKFKNRLENLLLDHLLSNSSKHLSKSEQEGLKTPCCPKHKHRKKKAHKQKKPVDNTTTYVLFLPYPENPNRPLSYPSQPPFIRISKYRLKSILALFSDPLEQEQNGQLGDDDDTIVYDATITHQPKKYIADQVVYTSDLINSYYSSCLDSHEEFSALSDDGIWNAFKNGLRLAKEGYLDERSLLERERMDLNLWVEYMNVEQ